MNNAVIYTRYSSVGQNEQSIEGQIRICKEFAESKGFNVVKVYIDKARSAFKETEKRVDFQKMISEASTGAFQHIIVYKFDRFARNRVDSMIHKQQLKKQYGIRVISATEPVSDDEGGEIYEMFLEWNDEKYSQRLSKRVRDGLDTSVANGTFCGGYLNYGYKIRKEPIAGKTEKYIKYVELDEEQTEIVKFVFVEYDKGIEKKEIAERLNEKGYRYKGKQFKGRDFDKWLTNEKYTGVFHFGERVCDNMYPPIIDKAMFDRVQERLKRNKYFSGANSARELYLLTGKAKCGCCETLMTADGGTSHTGATYHYYACKQTKKGTCEKKRKDKDDLELYVTKRVRKFCKENAYIVASDVVNFYEQRTSEGGLRSVEVQISHTMKRVEDLTNAFVMAKSDLLRVNIEKQMAEYEVLLQDLNKQKAQLELEKGLKITKEDILSYIEELVQGDENDKEYQKRLIDNLVQEVYSYDDITLITLSIRGSSKVEQVSLQDLEKAIQRIAGFNLIFGKNEKEPTSAGSNLIATGGE